MTSPSYSIEKRHWTDADFELMGWHDVVVHALAYDPAQWELLLDLDYIFKWVEPEADKTHYSFWISPATMVFHNVYDLCISVEPISDFQLDSIERSDPQQMRAGYEGTAARDWLWSIAVFNGEISLRSSGYSLWVRDSPRLSKSQALDLKERGGRSFDCGTEDR